MTTDRRSLVNEQALGSLRDEMKLRSLLDKSSWISVHSHHFFDTRESKWRELDAVAYKYWIGHLGERPVRIRVLFLIESKSLAEKHILLPPFTPLRQAVVFDWLGASHRKRERFGVYEQVGLPAGLATVLDMKITGGAAGVMFNAPNILMPPSAVGWNAASFSEVQNGQKKSSSKEDLGASVVWRARLALQSAAKAIAKSDVERSTQDLQLALHLALLRARTENRAKAEGTPAPDLAPAVLEHLDRYPFTITVFHPMVVVDADLWGVSEDELVEVQHARIHLTEVSRYPYFWFDLVRREAVDAVLSEAQDGYDDQADEKGIVPEEPSMGLVDYEVAFP